ncbi:MAG: glycosyl transferase family 28 [Rhodoferax sp.]|nr:glycosyl transferase family 28 [Rhodoferax sp.]
MSAPRVLVYVQHLLGSGHLRRAALLSEAMVRAGLDVTLVSGGLPVPGLRASGVRLVQLPPVAAADMHFKSLVDAQGQAVDVQLQDARRDQLLALFNDLRPQALVIELFPFGRRQMRFELLPLLDAARTAQPAPVIVSSVRDVLGGSRDPERQGRMLAYFERYFDHLLVHGDPALLPFERTFAPANRIGTRLHYTGYVVAPVPTAQAGAGVGAPGQGEVLVSAGGGAVGRGLLEAAIRARPLTALAALRWRVLVGAAMGPSACDALRKLAQQCAGDGIIVEPNRTDFSALLGRCRLSVSQAGYNTVMETLQAGARAVMVPFAGGAETEQGLRAQVLAEQHWIDIVEESALTPQTLAEAINRAAARPPLQAGAIRLDGAETSARLIAGWIQAVAP